MATYAEKVRMGSDTLKRRGTSTLTEAKNWQSDMKAAFNGEHKTRIEKMIHAAGDNAPPWASKYIKMLAPVIAILLALASASLPYVVAVAGVLYEVYKHTPTDLLEVGVGFVFCFAGGVYPTLFAAAEAARHCGWWRTRMAVEDLVVEAQHIIRENARDDMKDKDHDGKVDVNQMDGKELLLHKTRMVMTKMDPEKVNHALGGLYLSWVGVMAVLKVQFAKVVTLAVSMSNIMEKPIDTILVPIFKHFIPEEYHRWIPVCLNWFVKMCALSIAWWIQRVLSAATSAIVGGLMITRALMRFCVRHGHTFGGLIPKNDEDTYLDEILGWGIAFLGFSFQFMMGFSLPFPLNLFCWPIGILERLVQYQVTYS